MLLDKAPQPTDDESSSATFASVEDPAGAPI